MNKSGRPKARAFVVASCWHKLKHFQFKWYGSMFSFQKINILPKVHLKITNFSSKIISNDQPKEQAPPFTFSYQWDIRIPLICHKVELSAFFYLKIQVYLRNILKKYSKQPLRLRMKFSEKTLKKRNRILWWHQGI